MGASDTTTSRRPVGIAAVLAGVLAGVLTACAPQDSASVAKPADAAATPGTGDSVPAATSGTSRPASAATSDTAVRLPTLEVAGTPATGLNAPWGLAFLPDGSALVTQRDRGDIVGIPAGGGAPEPVGAVPGVAAAGEGGLLGLAVSPDFATDRWLYAYLTSDTDNRVVRLSYDPAQPPGRRLGTPQVLVSGIPRSRIHNGGRIAFGPDGLLYISTGDAAERSTSQDRASLAGKILRVTKEGRPAPGNPFAGSPVYSLGHRNVQGLAWDSQRRLWASEFGQNTFDELNQIEPGGNYGWPIVEGDGDDDRFRDPLVTWSPEDASPSGLAIRDDVAYVAGLRGQRLWQVPLGEPGQRRALLTEEYGRLRTVAPAPDGSLWVVTSNTDGRANPRDGDDRVLRLSIN